MDVNKTLLFFCFISLQFIFFSVYPQGIKGTITDVSGEPLPFANVYISDLSQGTCSNLDGDYELKLPTGRYKITYQNLGFQTNEILVSIEDSVVVKNVRLRQQQYTIPEASVYAGGEDPAWYVMRKAIALAPYYRNQIQSYACRIYLKGTGVFRKIPGLLERQMKKEGIEEGECLVTENISQITFELPDNLKQEVISARSNSYDQDIDPIGFITMNFYQETGPWVSPLEKRALQLYNFKLVSAYYDKGVMVNKIEVIPTREGYDLFSGYIHIANDYWNIHTVDLVLEQKMFQVEIKQLYNQVKEDIWMPVSHHFDVDFQAFGFEIDFQYAASVNYDSVERNEKLDHSFLATIRNNLLEKQKELDEVLGKYDDRKNGEELSKQKEKIQALSERKNLNNRQARKINRRIQEQVTETREKPDLLIEEKKVVSDSAFKRPMAYWDSIRPLPLTTEERKSYARKDSIDRLMENPEFEDSVKTAATRFRLKHLLFGHTYDYPENKSNLSYSGFTGLHSFSFNTVDGFVYKKQWGYDKGFENSKKIWFDHNISYAFTREKLLSDAKLSTRYNGLKRAYFSIEGGRQTADFNHNQTIGNGVNMINSLFLKENYVKYYQKDFIRLAHRIDVAHGLRLHTAISYEDRTQLKNNTDFNIWDPLNNEDYSPNIPDNRKATAQLIQDHSTFLVAGSLQYTPRYYYRVKDNIKQMLFSKYPTLTLKYKGGMPGIFHSGSDFHYTELSITHQTTVKRLGSINYQLRGGTFLSKRKLFFVDFAHFATHTPFLSPSLPFTSFRLMDYYHYSTNRSFFEGHFQLRNHRILLKHLPILNKTLMVENIYLNYLKATEKKNYFEIGYGLDQIFLLFNAEVFAGFRGTQHAYTGITIGLPFLSGSQTISVGD